jgi:hypothetical protein
MDNLNADWSNPSGRDVDAIMDSVKGSKEHLDDSKYGTPKAFVEKYAVALEDYLKESAGKGESHIHDFATLTLSFTEAFFHTVNNFS